MSDRPRSTRYGPIRGRADDVPPLAHDLVLIPVHRGAWRIADSRRPAGDPLRLLAFVEQRGSEFRVMQLGARFEWHEFGTMAEAIAHVCLTGPGLARERIQGDLAWIG